MLSAHNKFCCNFFYWLQQYVTFLVNDQRGAQILFYVFISIYNSLHFEHIVLIIFFQPADISATNIEWLLPEAVLIQFLSSDDEHDVLKTCRVINRNKYIEKNLRITFVIYQESLHDAQST
jgi:hypothetical protein